MDTPVGAARGSAPSLHILGVASGWGAPDTRCEHGPAAVRSLASARKARRLADTAQWSDRDLSPPIPNPCAGQAVARLCAVLASRTAALARRGQRFAVVGGDHSCAIGTWSGVARALRPSGRLGLIWFDAHMDAHVPETSPSGSLHGMPLACLLGHGAAWLTRLAGRGPALLPGHVSLNGVRSFEAEEQALLSRLGVRVFFMAEVRRRGLADVVRDAARIAGAGTVGFGVSIDLDALDPGEAPGVGSPVPDGLHAGDMVKQVRWLARRPDFLGFEVAELNPYRDRNAQTASLVIDLLRAVTRQ